MGRRQCGDHDVPEDSTLSCSHDSFWTHLIGATADYPTLDTDHVVGWNWKSKRGYTTEDVVEFKDVLKTCRKGTLAAGASRSLFLFSLIWSFYLVLLFL